MPSDLGKSPAAALPLLPALYEKHLRRTFQRFTKLTSDVYGLDKVFRIVVYTLSLVAHYVGARRPKSALVAQLKALVSALSDTRIAMRVFGIVPSIEYAVPVEYNPTLRVAVQNATMLVYHPAELMYWLGAHGIVRMAPLTLDRWSRLSCIAWTAWIALELWSLAQAMREAQRDARREGVDRAAARNKIKDLRLRLTAQLCDLPMAIHWSLPSYPLPGNWVALFGVVGGLAGGIRMWKATA
ncbi:hypothetical protein H9P43_004956 [Blastocladiella emersonii ATCC 22665]|nr:hypothetical protein H9P43_004956 [Blastocladiella emersonii ATCC 22665]